MGSTVISSDICMIAFMGWNGCVYLPKWTPIAGMDLKFPPKIYVLSKHLDKKFLLNDVSSLSSEISTLINVKFKIKWHKTNYF